MFVHFMWKPVEDWEEIYKSMTFEVRDRAQGLAWTKRIG
jgi:hypothetical protein